MTCKEIIEKYLNDNGFDGLVHLDTECGCHMGDAGLFLCEGDITECEPAYKHEPDDTGWTMRLYPDGVDH